VVGLNSDRSVRTLKGADRPVNPEQDRARILSSLACVDYVVIFDEETPLVLITTILPDVLVKGADWAEEDIVGAPEVKSAGGKVVRVVFEHNVSTSGLIARIQTRD
jgi:rfaE bifunctional protein nucleotidyltransferase chain/domain